MLIDNPHRRHPAIRETEHVRAHRTDVMHQRGGVVGEVVRLQRRVRRRPATATVPAQVEHNDMSDIGKLGDRWQQI
jgi:hypothetical protein